MHEIDLWFLRSWRNKTPGSQFYILKRHREHTAYSERRREGVDIEVVTDKSKYILIIHEV